MIYRHIFLVGLIVSTLFLTLGSKQAYAEEQPIAFSHKLHTVQNGIAVNTATFMPAVHFLLVYLQSAHVSVVTAPKNRNLSSLKVQK